MGSWLKKNELILFTSLLLIYSTTLVLKFNNYNLGWISNHLADLIALPLIFQMCSWGIRVLKNSPTFKLSATQILVGFIYTSTLFELILPHFNSKYTADIIDVLMYAMGSISFGIIQKSLK